MSNIHSNAYNFLSFVSAGVDSRTGTYSCSISFPDLLANVLSGPSLPLSIGFNALNNSNQGFANGWTMPLSRYNRHTRQLSLSTGATHIANTGPGQFVLADKKVRDLITTRVADELIIEHKTGLVEVLTNPSLNWDEWLVSKVYSPQGRVIHFNYSVVAGRRLLRDIRDESQLLLTVDVPAGSAVASSITLWPQSPADKLVYKFERSNGELTKLSLLMGNDAPASWRFTYKTVGGLRLITRLELPTDGVEQIAYRDGAMLLPSGAPLRALPAVESHIVFPRADQPPVTREYSYSANNYFGYGSNARWRNDGDNLYQATDNYQYECSEDLMLGSGAGKRVMRRTKRVYNRFHLQVEETTSQNGKTVLTRTQYPEKPGFGFEDQPDNFQLPIRTQTSYFDAAAPDVARHEVTLTEYDEFGNILRQVSPTGITEVFEYYPVGASDGCPADSFGAVRWLKQKTLIPAAGRAPAPGLTTRYRYSALPSADPGRKPFLVLAQESVLQDGQDTPLMVSVREYETDTRSLAFGRVKRKVETVGEIASAFDHRYELRDGCLCTHTTLTAQDGNSSHKTTWQNQLTGATVKTVEQLGVTVQVDHDCLGRKTREVVAPGTSSQALRNHSYRLANELNDPVETRSVAANGAIMLTRFDGMSRKSAVEVQDVDGVGQPMRSVYSARYDALGQLAEEIETDWLEGEPYALSTRHTYDDWGNRCTSTGPDGVLSHDRFDPVTLTQTQGLDKAGKTVISKNVFGKYDRVERFDRNDKSCGVTEYLYDGLGRCVQQVDPDGGITRFAYDFADRLVLTQLPDGTRVRKAFLPHSTEDLATHIWVNDYLVGERSYDGLLRVTQVTVGGRTETFTYEGAQPKPKSHITASGKVVTYQYDPALNNQTTERNVVGDSNLSARLQYDNTHARLLRASSPGNQQQQAYFPSGQLKSNRLVEGQDSADTVQRSSLKGLPLEYVDAAGIRQITRYDALCRVAQVEQGAVRAGYTYDSLGRVSRIETRDTQSNRKLVTQLEYDDFGREVRRVLTVDDGEAEVLLQRFNERDKLIRRTLERGNTVVRDETFAYDLRGRLEHYQCSGTHQPVDAGGKAILSQTYLFDELDNVRQVKTVFNGGENIATYEYQYPDKTQLSRISHSHADYAAQQATFTYDRDGNQLNDQRGRRMIYDDLGRLASVAQEQP